ncbi:MAG: cyclase family protein [Candidatus Aenigmarchaeota archaeon]|nr:cyclase family protein [Candidatus Aenigmarchaeota archaeon]
MKLIDLTMELSEDFPEFPGDPKPEFKNVLSVEKDGWNVTKLKFNSHFSTHIDSPYHRLENGKKLDDYPLDKFMGNGVVIDARNQKVIGADLSKVKKDAIVLLWTDYTKKFREKNFYKNNPKVSIKFAKELVKRRVKIIGIDAPSVEGTGSSEIHEILLKNDVLVIENLTNLDKLVGKKFDVIALPLKLKDADGSPARVIARIIE